MTVNGSATPSDSPRRRHDTDGDPLVMTEAEKLAAEWEARHDVAARGRRSAPDVLQHYLSHERLVGSSGSTAPPHGDRRDDRTSPAEDPPRAGRSIPRPIPGPPAAPRRRPGLFGWLRRST